MIVDSKNFNLHKSILNSLTLDSFEYCYLCPLLEQTGLYSGHTDVIFIAQKLSQQAQNIFHLKVLFQKSLQKSNKRVTKEDHIYLLLQFQIFNCNNYSINNENMLIEYYEQCISPEACMLHLYSFLFFEKYFYEVSKPTINNIILELSTQNNWEENVFKCIRYILIYKIWKIEYWYSVISKLAFDCKELSIAKHFVHIAKLEYNMICTLMNLFKYA